MLMKLRYARFGYMSSIIHEQIANVLSNDWTAASFKEKKKRAWIFESRDPVFLMLAGILSRCRWRLGKNNKEVVAQSKKSHRGVAAMSD